MQVFCFSVKYDMHIKKSLINFQKFAHHALMSQKKKEKTIKCKQKSIPLISLLRVFPCFEQLHKFTYSFDWPDVNALGFVSLCSRKTKLWGVMYFSEYQFFYLNIRQQAWFYFPSRWQDLHYERCFFL